MAIRFLLSTMLGARRWPQADLVRATGIRKGTICDLYNESATGIKFEHLELICRALDCKVEDLIYLDPDDKVEVMTRAGLPKK